MEPTVMVAWDNDDAADSALAWAARYQALAGGKLVLVHIAVPAVPIALEIPPTPISTGEIARWEETMREAARKHGASCTAHVAIAISVGSGLVDAAKAHNATLVCTGHSRGALAQLLLGSVANHLVRACTVPVVVVRAAAAR